MKSLWIVPLVGLAAISGANASNACETAPLSKLVPSGSSAVAAAAVHGVLFTAEFRACRFGKYRVLSPTDAETDLLIVLRDDDVLVATGISTPVSLEGGQTLPAPMGEGHFLSVWQRDRVLLVLQGQEADGTFHKLSYFPAPDGSGQAGALFSVVDLNLDGEQDMRLSGPYGVPIQVRIDGNWYNLEYDDGDPIVRVGDSRKRVIQTSDGYEFAGD